MKKIMIIVLFILLTGCSYKAKSYEECQGKSKCYFKVENVDEKDDSLSSLLQELKVYDSDVIYFNYTTHGGDDNDVLFIEFTSSMLLSENQIKVYMDYQETLIHEVSKEFDIEEFMITVVFEELYNVVFESIDPSTYSIEYKMDYDTEVDKDIVEDIIYDHFDVWQEMVEYEGIQMIEMIYASKNSLYVYIREDALYIVDNLEIEGSVHNDLDFLFSDYVVKYERPE